MRKIFAGLSGGVGGYKYRGAPGSGPVRDCEGGAAAQEVVASGEAASRWRRAQAQRELPQTTLPSGNDASIVTDNVGSSYRR